jgi:hypothetical protein
VFSWPPSPSCSISLSIANPFHIKNDTYGAHKKPYYFIGKTFTMEGGDITTDSKMDWETNPNSGMDPGG